MKKYHSISELITDYRNYYNLSKTEAASKLDVDVRTINRWESLESLITPEKEKKIVEKFYIPYQVIRNLNADNPIPVYYDIKNRTYALSKVMSERPSAEWYKLELPFEKEKVRYISSNNDADFINMIQLLNENDKLLNKEVIKEAARLLPGLNLVLHDQTGYYAGHISVLPLKYETYLKIKNREMPESSVSVKDLTRFMDNNTKVFYFYSMYADSLTNSYYLLNRLLSYFREKKFSNYLFAGITFRVNKVELLQELGLRVTWTDNNYASKNTPATFVEGTFDMFLFGKML